MLGPFLDEKHLSHQASTSEIYAFTGQTFCVSSLHGKSILTANIDKQTKFDQQ